MAAKLIVEACILCNIVIQKHNVEQAKKCPTAPRSLWICPCTKHLKKKRTQYVHRCCSQFHNNAGRVRTKYQSNLPRTFNGIGHETFAGFAGQPTCHQAHTHCYAAVYVPGKVLSDQKHKDYWTGQAAVSPKKAHERGEVHQEMLGQCMSATQGYL